MTTTNFNEKNGFQGEIDSTDVREMNIQVSNMNLTVLDATCENNAAFLLPESVETEAPTNISTPVEIAADADSCCAGLSVVSKMTPGSIEVDIQLIEPHPLVMKVRKEKDLGGLKLTMRLKGLLEPIKVVIRNKKYQIVDGISRYFAALELGWETITVIVVELSDEEIQEQFVF